MAIKKKTPEEKKQEIDSLLSVLDEGVKSFVGNPEKFKAQLRTQAMFRNYSFRNAMLIHSQMPSASFVAGYTRWRELGRNVIKGQKAIKVLGPRFKKELDEATGQEQNKLIGYILLNVFDASQTEGEPLPIDAFKLALNGESDEAELIFAWVKQLALEDDCEVEIAFANGANGYYAPITHNIVIDPKLSTNHRAKTMAHEYVHSQEHRFDGSTPEERECVAEGVAFIVCSFFGLDTSDYSFEYVNSWSSDNGRSLMKFGSTIQKSANAVINDIERIATGLPEPVAV